MIYQEYNWGGLWTVYVSLLWFTEPVSWNSPSFINYEFDTVVKFSPVYQLWVHTYQLWVWYLVDARIILRILPTFSAQRPFAYMNFFHWSVEVIFSVFGSRGFGSRGFGSKGFGSRGFGSRGFGSRGFVSRGFGSRGFDRRGPGKGGFGSTGFDRRGPGKRGFGSREFGSRWSGKRGFDRKEYDRMGVNAYLCLIFLQWSRSHACESSLRFTDSNEFTSYRVCVRFDEFLYLILRLLIKPFRDHFSNVTRWTLRIFTASL